MFHVQFRSLQLLQHLDIKRVFSAVSEYSAVSVFQENDVRGKATTSVLDFSASLISHRQLTPRLKSSYLYFSWHGGCNLHSVNFTFITLNFIYQFIAQSSLLPSAIPPSQ